MKLPGFANDLIRFFSEKWIYVVIAGVLLVMLGLVTCAKAGMTQ